MINNNQLFTPQQAAEYLGVKVQTLAIWRATKRYPIPYIKIGRLVKYKKEDLDAYISECAVSSKSFN